MKELKLECFVALCRALLHPQLIEEKVWVLKWTDNQPDRRHRKVTCRVAPCSGKIKTCDFKQMFLVLKWRTEVKTRSHTKDVDALQAHLANLQDAVGCCWILSETVLFFMKHKLMKRWKMSNYTSTWGQIAAIFGNKWENAQPQKRHDQKTMCPANAQHWHALGASCVSNCTFLGRGKWSVCKDNSTKGKGADPRFWSGGPSGVLTKGRQWARNFLKIAWKHCLILKKSWRQEGPCPRPPWMRWWGPW